MRAEREPARWTALAFGAGVASATLLMASASLFLARAGAASQDEFEFDPATANMFTNAAYAALVCSTMSAAILVLATSIVGLRTRVLPRWTALAGFVVAAVLLFAVLFVPIFVWLAWVLAVSIILILRTARVADWRAALARGAEANVEDVAVLDDVGLPLEPLEALPGGLGVRAGGDEVVPADHLGADEAVGDVRVDRLGGLDRGAAPAQRPGTGFLVTRREEADEVERGEEPLHDLIQRRGALAKGRGLLLAAGRPAPARARGRCRPGR